MGYIQRRFPAASIWLARFKRSVRRSKQRALFLKLHEHPPRLRISAWDLPGVSHPACLIVSVPFPSAPLQGTEGKGYLTIFFFMRFVFRGLKPTARNIQPLTRLLRKRNYVRFAHFVTAFHFCVRFSSAADTAAIQQVGVVAAFSRFLEASAASFHPLITSRTLRTSREVSSGANITNVLVRLRRTA